MKHILFTIAVMFGSLSVYAADAKPAPKVDCTQKKNASKIECKKAPEPKKEIKAKKPEKVDRKAPAAVQKKAAEENAKK